MTFPTFEVVQRHRKKSYNTLRLGQSFHFRYIIQFVITVGMKIKFEISVSNAKVNWTERRRNV